MRRLEDPYELIRVGNPVPDPKALPGTETPAGHDIISSILGDIPETRTQAADDVETSTATRTLRHAPGRRRVLAFAASFLAVLAVGSISVLFLATGPSGDTATPVPTEINPAQDLPEQTSAETEPALPEDPPPVYLLEHTSFGYVGGGVSDDSSGTVVELQWEGEADQLVEVTVFSLDSSNAAANLQAEAEESLADGYSVEEINADGRPVTHLWNEGGDHHYLWTEKGAAIRVRGFSLGESASEVFHSLHRYPLDSEQVQSLLTGGEEPAPDTDTPQIPSGIALALDSTVSSLLTQSGRQLASTDSSEEDGLQFESAVFSDGTEIVELIWQEWPTTVDFHNALTNDTRIEEQDGHEVTVRHHPEDNMIEVGIFDGSIYARAYTTFTSDLSEADIRQLAQVLYNAASETTKDE